MFRELPIASSLRCCKGLSMGDIRGFHIRDNQEYLTTFTITAAFEVVI